MQRGPERGRYRFGGWVLDRRARRLTDASGTVVTLSKGEYALLVAFMEAPQRPLSREQLLQATRIHEDVYDRTIDVQVLRLRRKLETEAPAPQIIQTERGVGYVFALPVEVKRDRHHDGPAACGVTPAWPCLSHCIRASTPAPACRARANADGHGRSTSETSRQEFGFDAGARDHAGQGRSNTSG